MVDVSWCTFQLLPANVVEKSTWLLVYIQHLILMYYNLSKELNAADLHLGSLGQFFWPLRNHLRLVAPKQNIGSLKEPFGNRSEGTELMQPFACVCVFVFFSFLFHYVHQLPNAASMRHLQSHHKGSHNFTQLKDLPRAPKV